MQDKPAQGCFFEHRKNHAGKKSDRHGAHRAGIYPGPPGYGADRGRARGGAGELYLHLHHYAAGAQDELQWLCGYVLQAALLYRDTASDHAGGGRFPQRLQHPVSAELQHLHPAEGLCGKAAGAAGQDDLCLWYRIFRHGGHLPDPEAGEHGHPVLQCHRRRLGGHF